MNFLSFFLFAGKKRVVRDHQNIIANHKEQISQVNDFSAFSMFGKMQEPGIIQIG